MFRPDDILARLRVRPFEPFRIVSSSGQGYDVTHPDLVIVNVRHVIIGHPARTNPGVSQSESQVALMHVTDLQPMSGQTLSTAQSGA